MSTMQKIRERLFDKKSVTNTKASLNDRGHEVLSSVPVAASLNLRRPETLAEKIRREVIQEMQVIRQMTAENGEKESFEEADDFEVGDDFDTTSPYEDDFDSPLLQRYPASEPAGAGSGALEPPVDYKAAKDSDKSTT